MLRQADGEAHLHLFLYPNSTVGALCGPVQSGRINEVGTALLVVPAYPAVGSTLVGGGAVAGGKAAGQATATQRQELC